MTTLDTIAKMGQMIWVVKPSQYRIEELRNAMTFKKRMEFRYSLEDHKLFHYGFDIHHIIPISYGGSNAFRNMCLVSKEAHELIHYYIDQMNKPMHPHQRGYVWIPIIKQKVLCL